MKGFGLTLLLSTLLALMATTSLRAQNPQNYEEGDLTITGSGARTSDHESTFDAPSGPGSGQTASANSNPSTDSQETNAGGTWTIAQEYLGSGACTVTIGGYIAGSVSTGGSSGCNPEAYGISGSSVTADSNLFPDAVVMSQPSFRADYPGTHNVDDYEDSTSNYTGFSASISQDTTVSATIYVSATGWRHDGATCSVWAYSSVGYGLS